MSPPETPRIWHLPPPGLHDRRPARRVLMGRQGIFTVDAELVAYELLFRAPGREGLRVDLWEAQRQDRATEHVVAAAFHLPGQSPPDRVSFINFTRSYLINRPCVGFTPEQAVIEVVESSYADAALRNRLRDLRAEGYRIAIDDFVATSSQLALLEHADYVKIDARDLLARGPELAVVGRSHGSQLIVERVEDQASVERCHELGFDLYQGHAFEPAVIVDRGDDPSA